VTWATSVPILVFLGLSVLDLGPAITITIMIIQPKSRTERLRKTQIGTEVAHVTCDSDTTFKVKGQLAVGGAYCGGLPHSLFIMRRLQLRFDFDSTAVRVLIKCH